MTIEPHNPAAAAAAKVPVAVGRPQGDLDSMWRFAQALAQSNLLPQALRNKPSDVMVTVLYGQELGLAPMQAIQGVYVVNGRPTLAAQTWVALARKAGHKVRVLDEKPDSCTVAVYRSDDPEHPVIGTFTLEDAKRAGLASKDVWKQHPGAMLYARAASIALRRGCPEIALGFYTEHEVEEPQRPTLATVAAERTDRSTAPDAPDDEQAAARVAKLAAEHETAAPTAGQPQLTKLHAFLSEHGIDRDYKIRLLRAMTGRPDLTSSAQLTRAEATRVMDQLDRLAQDNGADTVLAIDQMLSHLEEQHGWAA